MRFEGTDIVVLGLAYENILKILANSEALDFAAHYFVSSMNAKKKGD
jgi:hypothetical protein